MLCFSLALTFQSGQEGIVGATDMMETCSLEDNEKVTNVTVYTRPYGSGQIVQGLDLLTTLQTCGPYGTVSADREKISGHQLLYVSGGAGALLDFLKFHFDYGCTHI